MKGQFYTVSGAQAQNQSAYGVARAEKKHDLSDFYLRSNRLSWRLVSLKRQAAHS